MLGYILYGMIILGIILLIWLVHDRLMIMRILGMIALMGSFCTIIVGYIAGRLLVRLGYFMNMMGIRDIIIRKFLVTGLFMALVGCLLMGGYIIGYIINKDNRKEELVDNSSIRS